MVLIWNPKINNYEESPDTTPSTTTGGWVGADSKVADFVQWYNKAREDSWWGWAKNLSEKVGNAFSSVANVFRSKEVPVVSNAFGFATDVLWGIAETAVNLPNIVYGGAKNFVEGMWNIWDSAGYNLVNFFAGKEKADAVRAKLWDNDNPNVSESLGQIGWAAMNIFDSLSTIQLGWWLVKQWYKAVTNNLFSTAYDDVASQGIKQGLKKTFETAKPNIMEFGNMIGKSLQIADPITAVTSNLIKYIPTPKKLEWLRDWVANLVVPWVLLNQRRSIANSYADALSNSEETVTLQKDLFNKTFNSNLKTEEFVWLKQASKQYYDAFDSAKTDAEKVWVFQNARDYFKQNGVQINTISDFQKNRDIVSPTTPGKYKNFLENIYALDDDYVNRNPIIRAVNATFQQNGNGLTNEQKQTPDKPADVTSNILNSVIKSDSAFLDKVATKPFWEGIVWNVINPISDEVRKLDEKYKALNKIDPTNTWLTKYSDTRKSLMDFWVAQVQRLASNKFDVEWLNDVENTAGIVDWVTLTDEFDRQIGIKKNNFLLGTIPAFLSRTPDKIINAITDGNRNLDFENYNKKIFTNFLGSLVKELPTLSSTIFTSVVARGAWSKLGKAANILWDKKYGAGTSALFGEIWEEIWFDFGQSVAQGEKYDQWVATAALAGIVWAGIALIKSREVASANVLDISDSWIEWTLKQLKISNLPTELGKELLRPWFEELRKIAKNDPDTASKLISTTGANIATQQWADAVVSKIMQDVGSSVSQPEYSPNLNVTQEYWTTAKQKLAMGEKIPVPNMWDLTPTYVNTDLNKFMTSVSSSIADMYTKFSTYVEKWYSPDRILNLVSNEINGKVVSNWVTQIKSLTWEKSEPIKVKDLLPKTLEVNGKTITPTYQTEKEIIMGLDQSAPEWTPLPDSTKKFYKSLIEKRKTGIFGLGAWTQLMTPVELLSKGAIFNSSDFFSNYKEVVSKDIQDYINEYEVYKSKNVSSRNLEGKLNLGDFLNDSITKEWVVSIFSEDDLPPQYQNLEPAQKNNVVGFMNNMVMQWNLSLNWSILGKDAKSSFLPWQYENIKVYERLFRDEFGLNIRDYRFDFYKEGANFVPNDASVSWSVTDKWPIFKIVGDLQADKLINKLLQKRRFLGLNKDSVAKIDADLKDINSQLDEYVKKIDKTAVWESLGTQIETVREHIESVNTLGWRNPFSLMLNKKLSTSFREIWANTQADFIDKYLPVLSLTDVEWLTISYSKWATTKDSKATNLSQEEWDGITKAITNMVADNAVGSMEVLSWHDNSIANSEKIASLYSSNPMWYKNIEEKYQSGTINSDIFATTTGLDDIEPGIINKMIAISHDRFKTLEKLESPEGIIAMSAWEKDSALRRQTQESLQWFTGKEKYDELMRYYNNTDYTTYDRLWILAELATLDMIAGENVSPMIYIEYMWGIDSFTAGMIFGFQLFDKENIKYIEGWKATTRAFEIVDKYLGQWVFKWDDISVSDVAFLNAKKKKEVEALSKTQYEQLKNATINKIHSLWDIYKIKDIDSYKVGLENREKDNIVKNYNKEGINTIDDVISDVMKNEKIFTSSWLTKKLDSLTDWDSTLADNAVFYDAGQMRPINIESANVLRGWDYLQYTPIYIETANRWDSIEATDSLYPDTIWVKYEGKGKKDYYVLFADKSDVLVNESDLRKQFKKKASKWEDANLTEQNDDIWVKLMQKRARGIQTSDQDKIIVGATEQITQQDPSAWLELMIEWARIENMSKERITDGDNIVLPYVLESLDILDMGWNIWNLINGYNPEKKLLLAWYISNEIQGDSNIGLDVAEPAVARAIDKYNIEQWENLVLKWTTYRSDLAAVIAVSSAYNDTMSDMLRWTIETASDVNRDIIKQRVEEKAPELTQEFFPTVDSIVTNTLDDPTENYMQYFEIEQKIDLDRQGVNLNIQEGLGEQINALPRLSEFLALFNVLPANVIASSYDTSKRYKTSGTNIAYNNMWFELQGIQKRAIDGSNKYVDAVNNALSVYLTNKTALINAENKTQEQFDAIVLWDIISTIAVSWANTTMPSDIVNVLSNIPQVILANGITANQIFGLANSFDDASMAFVVTWVLNPDGFKYLAKNFDEVFGNRWVNRLTDWEKENIFNRIGYNEAYMEYNGFMNIIKKWFKGFVKVMTGRWAIWPLLMATSFTLNVSLGAASAVMWMIPTLTEFATRKRMSFGWPGFPVLEYTKYDRLLDKLGFSNESLLGNIRNRADVKKTWGILARKLAWGIPQLANELLLEEGMLRASLNDYLVNNGYHNRIDELLASNDVNELATIRSAVDTNYKKSWNGNYIDSKLNALYTNTIFNYVNLLGNWSVSQLRNTVNNLSWGLMARKIVDSMARWQDVELAKRNTFQNLETIKAWTILSKSILWGFRYASLLEDEDENIDSWTMFKIFSAASNIWQNLDSSPITRAIKNFTITAFWLDEDKEKLLKEVGINTTAYAFIEWFDQLLSSVKRRFFFPDAAISALLQTNDTDAFDNIMGRVLGRWDVVEWFIGWSINSQIERFIPRTKQDWLTNLLWVQLNAIKEQDIDSIWLKRLLWAVVNPETFGRYFFERLPYLGNLYNAYSIEDGKLVQQGWFPSKDLISSSISDLENLDGYVKMKQTGELPDDLSKEDYGYIMQKLTQFSYSKTPFNEKLERMSFDIDKSKFINQNLRDSMGEDNYNLFIDSLSKIDKGSDFKTNVAKILYDIKAKNESNVNGSAINELGMMAFVMKDGIAKKLWFYGGSDKTFYENKAMTAIADKIVVDALGGYIHVADRWAFADIGMKYASQKLIEKDDKYKNLFENGTSEKWWIKDTYVKNQELSSAVEWDLISSMALEKGDFGWVFMNNALADMGTIRAFDKDLTDFENNPEGAERFKKMRDAFTAAQVIDLNEKLKNTSYNEMESLAIITPLIANNFGALNKVIKEKLLPQDKIEYLKDVILGKYSELNWVEWWIQELNKLYNDYSHIKSSKKYMDSSILPKSSYFGQTYGWTKKLAKQLADIKLEFDKFVLPKIKDLDIKSKIYEPKLRDGFTKEELRYFKSEPRYFGNEPANTTKGVSTGKLPTIKIWGGGRKVFRRIGRWGSVTGPFKST